MNNFIVLVKSDEIEDFDDIYEGCIPEVIDSYDKLEPFLSSRFGALNWAKDGKYRVGNTANSSLKIKLDACKQGDVRMITIENAELRLVHELCNELGLTILGKDA